MRDERLNTITLGEVWVFPKNYKVKVAENFWANEFDCREKDLSNHFTLASHKLIIELQWLRDLIKQPIKILSGFRTQQHNKDIGGSDNSFHTMGLAADIVVPSMEWEDVKPYVDAVFDLSGSKIGGIGYYPERKFFHLDVRPRIDNEIVTWVK